MALDLNTACQALAHTLPDCSDRMAAVFARMDGDYAATAGYYGFVCDGCEENCCRTHFRHHTLVEYAYLQQGFAGLEHSLRREIRARAHVYHKAQHAAESRDTPFRHWCPLNREGRCLLYTFRPMICRLHGLPHNLHHPARGLIQGPGCHIFEAQCRNVPARPLDRSGLYKLLAGLEQAARQATGFRHPIAMTVADMILAFPEAHQFERLADHR